MRNGYLQTGSEATAFKLQNTFRTLKAVASLPFCTVLVAACFFIGNSGVMAQAVDKQRSQEVQPANWKRFVSAEGRFSILFPGVPTMSEQTLNHPVWKFVLHKHQLQTFAEYGVIYADYPKSVTDGTSADVLLDEGAKGADAEVNSKLMSVSPISVAGYPGRLVKRRMPNGSNKLVQMVLAGQRMYQVSITTPQEDGADQDTVRLYGEIATKFLESFELIGSVTPEPLENSRASQRACPPDLSNCVSLSEALNVRAISLPQPAYPPIARAAHASGMVEVAVVVDESGDVISAQAISGHPLLQAAAVAAARHAKFTPLRVDNKPLSFSGIIQYTFVLN